MFKKALQVAATFGLLLAGYAGYDRAFALLAARIRAAQVMPVERFEARPAENLRKAVELAVRAFGPEHWSADPARDMFRFYSAERGYWMYAKNYKSLKDGKLLVFEPFALIWVSRDEKELKTATSDKAIVLLDQPYDLGLKLGGGSELHVVNARLEGNVHLRDDKGTPNPDDDLRISGREGEGMTYAEYDEVTQKITHDSHVLIEDGEMRVSGKVIEITLRPKESGLPGKTAGFSGAQTIYLRKDVQIIIKDVGQSGVMPGSSKSTAPKQGAKTPLYLRSDGLARFDLPKPQAGLAPQVAGPPAPPLPTLAEFDRNVEVTRGRPGEPQDRLLCDHLRLIFYPGEGAPSAGRPTANVDVEVAAKGTRGAQPKADTEAGPASAGSPLGGLVLRRAVATGHNVELFSPAQGLKVRHCNELIHDKLPGRKAGETDDKTYLRTDLTRKLEIDKLEFANDGPDKGKLANVHQIRCIDATVFQNGSDNENATIVARGPGIFESRPALDKPVERTAVWNDQLQYAPVHNPKGELRKTITLTDSPKFHAIAEQTTLDAREKLVIFLRPKPAVGPKGSAGGSASEAFEIDTLIGFGDVHLNAPGRHLTAVERLDAEFQPAPAGQSAPAGPSKVVVAGDPFSPGKPAPAAPAPDTTKVGAKPGEPPVFVRASRVRAQIVMLPADGSAPGTSGNNPGRKGAQGSKGELRTVYLAGAVTFHQDPAPGESKGTDVSGEACWGKTSGDGLWQFSVYDHDPIQGKSFSDSGPAGSSVADLPPARVANKDMTVEGPLIGLNQATDTAWVIGPGKLVMMTERELLRDKESENPAERKLVPTVATVRAGERAPATPNGKSRPPTEKVPVTITWTTEMHFFGQSQDPTGRPTARAEFLSDPKDPPVKRFRFPTATLAETENSLLKCQDMKVYFDRPIKLAKLGPTPAAGGASQNPDAEPEPKHDINLIECFDNVTAISRKLDDSKRFVVQQERVEGSQLVYDKVTGDFFVPGKGVVKYWNVEGDGTAAQPSGSDSTQRRPSVTRMSNTRRQKPAANSRGTRPTPDPKKPAGSATPKRQLELTTIKFDHDMKGNFLPGKEGERKADFFGNVEALHAPVTDTKVEFDFDKPPAQYSLMTAQTMRLISEPPAANAPAGSPTRTYMQAFDNAHVTRQDSTIQADKITYDSEKDLFWAYGYEGRLVSITQYKGIGQDPSHTEGRAAYLIHRTGEAQLVDPQNFQLIDGKTGVRPVADPPDSAKRANRPKRSRPASKGDIERRTFTGS